MNSKPRPTSSTPSQQLPALLPPHRPLLLLLPNITQLTKYGSHLLHLRLKLANASFRMLSWSRLSIPSRQPRILNKSLSRLMPRSFHSHSVQFSHNRPATLLHKLQLSSRQLSKPYKNQSTLSNQSSQLQSNRHPFNQLNRFQSLCHRSSQPQLTLFRNLWVATPGNHSNNSYSESCCRRRSHWSYRRFRLRSAN